MSNLGKLEKVELRKVWKNEAGDFTPWLAREENIKILGDVIDLELEVESQEENVGLFRADILCKDTASNNWVLIENQLERTDHIHLGQLLTYAAGLEAVTIVWIAQNFTEEHRAALDWLNEKTGEDVNFFGLEIELWQIGESPFAPKFNLVSKPNDWTKTVKAIAKKTEMTENQKLRLEFWTGYKDFLQKNSIIVRPQKPNESNWMNHSIGKSGIYLASVFSYYSNTDQTYEVGEIRAELVINSKDYGNDYYEKLYSQKNDIEEKLGFEMEWYEKEGQVTKGAVIRKSVDVKNKKLWMEFYIWLKDHIEKIHTVISPIVKDL